MKAPRYNGVKKKIEHIVVDSEWNVSCGTKHQLQYNHSIVYSMMMVGFFI